MTLRIHSFLLFVVFLSALYLVGLALEPSATLNDALDGFLIGLCIAVAGQYAHWAFTRPNLVLDRPTMLRLGITFSWFATGVWRVERFLMQIHFMGYEGPVGAHDPLRGFMILLLSVGAMLHLFAFNMADASSAAIGCRGWRIALLSGGSGFALVELTQMFYGG